MAADGDHSDSDADLTDLLSVVVDGVVALYCVRFFGRLEQVVYFAVGLLIVSAVDRVSDLVRMRETR